jgi:hypothetical protein
MSDVEKLQRSPTNGREYHPFMSNYLTANEKNLKLRELNRHEASLLDARLKKQWNA